MEVLRFENSYQQRQIWREIYTGLGPVVSKELNQLSEARKNGKAITDQQQQQHHPQPHHQHPRQLQQHHPYPQQSRQHHEYPQQQQHQHPKKPLQHHHQHNHHQQQLAGLHRANTSILGTISACWFCLLDPLDDY